MSPNAWPWLWIFSGIAGFAVGSLLMRMWQHDTEQDARDEAEIADLLDRSAYLTSVYGVELDDEPATVKESLPVGVVKESLTTERDENDLIPRARHRQLIAIEAAAEKYVKNYRSTDNFEALAKAVRVAL